MRTLSKEKVPQPDFNYSQFYNWLMQPHKKFAIEIGCGVGFHPIYWAKEHLDSKILAIERTHDKFEKFSNRLEHHKNLTNVFPAHADAGVLLPHLKISGLVDDYFILYPNPYPKNKHSNLRFSNSPLTRFLIDTLKIGGQLTIATNIDSYAQELRAELPKNGTVTLIEDIVLAANSSSKNEFRLFSIKPRSHFEKKYLSRGDQCYNLVFRRDK